MKRHSGFELLRLWQQACEADPSMWRGEDCRLCCEVYEGDTIQSYLVVSGDAPVVRPCKETDVYAGSVRLRSSDLERICYGESSPQKLVSHQKMEFAGQAEHLLRFNALLLTFIDSLKLEAHDSYH